MNPVECRNQRPCSTGIRFCAAGPEDLERLVETRVLVLRAANGLSGEVPMDTVRRESEAYYRRALAKGRHAAFFALDGDRIIGTGGVSFYTVMPTYHNSTGRKAYLMNLYTDPAYRRRGIARQMVNLLLEECRARGISQVTLEATEMGRPLYEAMGFRPMPQEMELPEDFFAEKEAPTWNCGN